MLSFFRRTLLSIRSLILMLLIFTITGCGSVEWFPEYERLPITPDQFSFAPKTGVELSASVTSDPITVSGLTGDSSPISVTGSDSKYTVTGADGAVVAGAVTVKNGDKVTVTHTAASTLGTSTFSDLTIGDFVGRFTSVTRIFTLSPFSSATQFGPFLQAFATITSVDGLTGTHTISIKGNASSTTALYSVGDANGNPTTFTNETRTITTLNGLRIFVRNLPGTTTVLTIDGIDVDVVLPATAP